MFQLAQIDAGGLTLNYQSVSFADLISDCLESFTEIAKRKSVDLHGSVSPVIGEVEIDAKRINRVLNNLVDNALHHTQDNGRVEVLASQIAEGIRVVVDDNGSGIPAEELPFIFDKFYRGDQSRRENSQRSGLGLAIAKGIIDAHGGEISVSSKPGQTRFIFTIPHNTS